MLDRLMRKLGLDEASRAENKALAAAIDHLLDCSDKRLRLVPGYQQKLMPGMKCSQRYLTGLMGKLPPAMDLSLRAYATDPRLGLLFAGPSSLLSMLEESAALREFFLSASNGDEAWALMTMQHSETTRFGMVLENDELRSDVAQTVVSFDGHRLTEPSVSLEMLQAQAERRGQEILCAVVSRQLVTLEKARQQLEAEVTSLQLRKLTLSSGTAKVIDGQADVASLPDTLTEVNARLEEALPQLELLKQRTSLDGTLQMACHILEHPAEYFQLEQINLHLNRMGVKFDSAEVEGVTTLQLEELVLGKEQNFRRALLPVHVSREAISELRQQFGD